MTKDTPIRFLKGIGEARANAFAAAGINTAYDLLCYLPRSYQFRGDVVSLAEAEPDEVVSVVATVTKQGREVRSARGMTFITASATDGSGMLEITYFNSRWMLSCLQSGRTFRFYGKLTRMPSGLCRMVNPITEAVYENTVLSAVSAVYPLQGKLTQNIIASAVAQVLPLCDEIEDVLHPDIINKYGLKHRGDCLRELHCPTSRSSLEQAGRTMAFEEMLIFRLALMRMKSSVTAAAAKALTFSGSGIRLFFDALPYKLTSAQERTVKEILGDMCTSRPMMRLVQGDVGSGKTVVAAAAIYFAVKNGGQAAMMAPTEILASQHCRTLCDMLSHFGIRVELLSGSTTAAEKRRIKEGLADGSIHVAVGTHALIQGDVVFKSLYLAVTDEQHRFGVMQRASLVDKGVSPLQPHTLVMSATPIPRTLSLVLYGDLNVSVIDQLPPGRQVIQTVSYPSSRRDTAYQLIRDQLDEGHQAYIICPLVEEGDDGKSSAESYIKQLSGTCLQGVKAEVVHGRLSPKEKEKRMRAFSDGSSKLLISTTVVEVGVDVPNATVMLIENAECFGLSQLHQLRGRVGRGSSQSYCILMAGSKSKKALSRLKVMCSTSNGFEVAEADLKQRGPGDFFGSRQSGDIKFEFSDALDLNIINETGMLAADMPEGYITYAMESRLQKYFSEGGKTFN